MQAFLSAHPTVVPLAVLACVVSALLAVPAGRRLGCSAPGAGLLLLACLLPLALTLGPQLPLELGEGRGCASRVRPYRWWGQGGEELANLLLLVPVGVLAPLLLRARHAVVLLVLAAGFPWGVELTQYALPQIGRECDVTDVLLNGSGLVVGTVLGLVLLGARRLLRWRRPVTAAGAAGPS